MDQLRCAWTNCVARRATKLWQQAAKAGLLSFRLASFNSESCTDRHKPRCAAWKVPAPAHTVVTVPAIQRVKLPGPAKIKVIVSLVASAVALALSFGAAFGVYFGDSNVE